MSILKSEALSSQFSFERNLCLYVWQSHLKVAPHNNICLSHLAGETDFPEEVPCQIGLVFVEYSQEYEIDDYGSCCENDQCWRWADYTHYRQYGDPPCDAEHDHTASNASLDSQEDTSSRDAGNSTKEVIRERKCHNA